MFKTDRTCHETTQRGDATRDHILDVALDRFRERGFDRATMREIAAAAEASLGAAYYYFPSKDALVHAFYERVQQAHHRAVEATCARSTDLSERIQSALMSKLDIVGPDRALLGALFRYVGDADHPLSVFGEATHAQREAAVATFALALERSRLPERLAPGAARALWLAHLGLLLCFIHDRSPGQEHTRRLAVRLTEAFCSGLRLAVMPGAARMLAPLFEALGDVGFVPREPVPSEVSP